LILAKEYKPRFVLQQNENVGCRFIVTDAKSEAVSINERQSLVLLDSETIQSADRRLMLLDFMTT
jgi:hypothetical protein